jgi:predicted phosphodiesterase
MLGDRTDLTFHYPPSKHDVITYVDVADTRIAFTHGHHAKSINQMPQWVANQAASTRSPMRDASIVCHGHHHQPGYSESRGRAIVSCSMFDPGSSWYENLTGEFSRPSIATFSIRNKRVYNLRFVEPE